MDYIEKDLISLAVRVADLKYDPDQARIHDDRGIEEIAKSLSEHGQKKPIVIERSTKIVKAGNGTLMAAKLLGWEWVAAVQSDDVAGDLELFALRDNRTQELSLWDTEALLLKLSDGIDLSDLGWDDVDVNKLISSASPKVEFGSERPSKSSEPKHKKAMVSLVLTAEQSNAVESAVDTVVSEKWCSRGEALGRICDEWRKARQ